MYVSILSGKKENVRKKMDNNTRMTKILPRGPEAPALRYVTSLHLDFFSVWEFAFKVLPTVSNNYRS